MPKYCVIALAALLGSLTASATPLTGPAAVHTQPDVMAPVIKILAAGTEPTPATTPSPDLPAGWMAVQQAGPFKAYVQNGDIDKALNVKPGSSIHLEPDGKSGVLTTMEPGDKATITGLHGKWSQIQLDKTIVGYIRVSPATTAAPPTSASPVAATPAPAPAPSSTSSSTTMMPVNSAGPVAPTVDRTDSGVLPRFFQGQIVSTRRPFTPRRPYDWQLNDAAGVRYAYLDISHLLLTDQIENYAGHDVIVYGTPKAMPDGRNIVIQVESLRLK